MKQKILLSGLFILFLKSLNAQQGIPIIKATSNLVDIRVGNKFEKGAWTISPVANPDIYWTSSKNSQVTFYTDQDSISFKIQPDKEYYFIILLNGKDSALTLIKYIELVQMKLPVSLIVRWDSTNRTSRPQNVDTSLKLPYIIKPSYLYRVQPCLVRENQVKGLHTDTLWMGEITDVVGKDMVNMEIPFSSIDPHKRTRLCFRITYAQDVKVKNIGNAAFETEVGNAQSLSPASQPFRFSVESNPTNAELFYMDKESWDFHQEKLRAVFKEIDKAYDLNMIPDKKDIIQILSGNVNPMGFTTPTDIYVFDTPYILFVKINNKIVFTKLEPNRFVPEMNKKRVNLIQ